MNAPFIVNITNNLSFIAMVYSAPEFFLVETEDEGKSMDDKAVPQLWTPGPR